MSKKPIIIIVGPTASGKTSLAIKLAQKFNGEIISADSRSIYRKMNIGTSKPSKNEQKLIKHHLLDVKSPDESFSLADYKILAEKDISEIQKNGKKVFLVGGTGLYIDAVIHNYNLAETKPNSRLRARLEKIETEKLAEQLKKIDPKTYEFIDKKNKRKLIRALEVSLTTNKSFFSSQQKKDFPDNVLYLILDIPREELYSRINQRIDSWIKNGLLDETKELSKQYSFNLPSMSSIGYKELADFLEKNITLNEAVEIMKKRTRNYAKRQITWFKRTPEAVWIKDYCDAEKAIKNFLK